MTVFQTCIKMLKNDEKVKAVKIKTENINC